MRRYLVLQSIILTNSQGAVDMQEPVMDFDALDSANDWINEQANPTSFTVQDQFPQDDFQPEFEEQESMFDEDNSLFDDSHYFSHYESGYHYRDDMIGDEYLFDSDGDGDSD